MAAVPRRDAAPIRLGLQGPCRSVNDIPSVHRSRPSGQHASLRKIWTWPPLLETLPPRMGMTRIL